MKKIKNLFSLNIICLFIISTLLVFFILKPAYTASVLEINENDLIIGDINAPITIIEYASLSCIHCKDFHTNTLPQIIKEYVDTKKVKIVFRDFPLNYPALMGSMLLQCIEKNIRYNYRSALFILQSDWVKKDYEVIAEVLSGPVKDRLEELEHQDVYEFIVSAIADKLGDEFDNLGESEIISAAV